MDSFELFFEEDDDVRSIRELARKRKVLRDSSGAKRHHFYEVFPTLERSLHYVVERCGALRFFVEKEILNVLEENICAKWITFNFTLEEKLACKMYFYDTSKIPGVIGCVDGTHIRIIKQKEQLQHLYYNRKGYFSINAMVVCDHQMRIRYINGKHSGSSHDSLVWNLSKLKNQLQRAYDNGDKNSWLLGDAGYSLQP